MRPGLKPPLPDESGVDALIESPSSFESRRRLSHDGGEGERHGDDDARPGPPICAAVNDRVPSNVSVFAGRIADSGRAPAPLMTEAVEILREAPVTELTWASPRERLTSSGPAPSTAISSPSQKTS